MKKIILWFILAVLVFFLIFFTFFKNTFYQEWNPIPVLKAIWEILFTKNNFVEFKTWKYITPTKSEYLMKDFMKNKWYIYQENMWAWYIFKNNFWDKKIITWRQFSRFFRVYYISFK